MSHIAKIHFESVDNAEHGCTCDRCGQWIKNIWTVDYTEGFSVHYGIDCWEKVYKGGKLNKYGEKEMRKAMKSIKSIEENIASWKNGEITPDNHYPWIEAQEDKQNPWYDKSWDEYKDWMINEFWAYRLEEAQKELKKFSKINFND